MGRPACCHNSSASSMIESPLAMSPSLNCDKAEVVHHLGGRGGAIELEKEVSGLLEVTLGTLELVQIRQHQATRAVKESEPALIVRAFQDGLCQLVQIRWPR